MQLLHQQHPNSTSSATCYGLKDTNPEQTSISPSSNSTHSHPSHSVFTHKFSCTCLSSCLHHVQPLKASTIANLVKKFNPNVNTIVHLHSKQMIVAISHYPNWETSHSFTSRIHRNWRESSTLGLKMD